jgi:predicted PurR-regulated permease PerM
MKRLAGYAVVVMATLGAFVVLWQFRSVLILFLHSLVIAAVVRPLLARLVALRLPAAAALVLVYLLALAAVVLVFYLIGGQLLDELARLSNELVLLYHRTYTLWESGTPLQRGLAQQLPPPDQLPEVLAGPVGMQLMQTVFGVTTGVAAAVASLLLIIVLSVYWSADQNHFERLWLSVLPAGRRMQARQAWRGIEMTVGDYVRSEFIQAALAALILGLGYGVMGLNYPILLALASSIAWLIPLAGVIIIGLLAVLVGFASGGWALAGAAVAYTLVVLALLEFVVEPRLLRRQATSGLLTILLMLPLVDSYGLVGFVLAPPLAVALQVVVGNVLRAYLQPRTAGTAVVEIEQLERRYEEVYALFEEEEAEPIPPEIVNILERLQRLISETKGMAKAEG